MQRRAKNHYPLGVQAENGDMGKQEVCCADYCYSERKLPTHRRARRIAERRLA
jgi:hypothetical protein